MGPSTTRPSTTPGSHHSCEMQLAVASLRGVLDGPRAIPTHAQVDRAQYSTASGPSLSSQHLPPIEEALAINSVEHGAPVSVEEGKGWGLQSG